MVRAGEDAPDLRRLVGNVEEVSGSVNWRVYALSQSLSSADEMES